MQIQKKKVTKIMFKKNIMINSLDSELNQKGNYSKTF